MDVGNSNIVVGIYDGDRLCHHWRISTMSERTADELGILVKGLFRDRGVSEHDLQGVAVSCVVPPLMSSIEEMCRNHLRLSPLTVGPGIKTGLPIRYENPREVGSDRIVNAVAAVHRYGPPLIIVDFGTATTFGVVDDKGNYLGGAIAPGIRIASDALFRQAAKLPRVELVRPKQVVARTTVASIQSGVLYGFAGLVDGIVERIKAEVGLNFRVIATGGMAHLVSPDSRTIDLVDPVLNMEGLRLLWEKNQPQVT